MPDERDVWRVGVVGIGAEGLFQLERLSLSREIRLVRAYDQNQERQILASHFGCVPWDRATIQADLKLSSTIDAVCFVDDHPLELVRAAVVGGRHVVLYRPWLLSSAEILSLNQDVAAANHRATIACVRRWSADFTAAFAAIEMGRIGSLQTVRCSSYEQRVPEEKSAAGILREFGYHWFDQLLALSRAQPQAVFGKLIGNGESAEPHAFLAAIDFTDGCTAQIEISTRSRLSHRTGWMLEGSAGSYRNNRLYSSTADGEIVDEPLTRQLPSDDPLIGELLRSWHDGKSTLPTLAHAANVVKLIEAIEQSSKAGEVVRL